MAQTVAVTGVILTAAALAVGIGQLVVALDSGDDTLQSKDHWMHCTVRNETQFDIVYNREYWDSGTYYQGPPQKITKFSAGTFSVCKKTGFAGVSGGNSWKIILDDKTVFHFSLGYTDPVVGSRKSAAVDSDGNPKTGYEAAAERGCSGRSPIYEGKDEDGELTYFIIDVTSVTGHHSTYTIQQSEVKGWRDP
ncbi:hypothetical protein M426DRAFT_322010 [Hypoxylon sp. CI-4A]|nr:hypothetical protein M426DRAFT_322010 [Hypoxylon sp. CI-4A]